MKKSKPEISMNSPHYLIRKRLSERLNTESASATALALQEQGPAIHSEIMGSIADDYHSAMDQFQIGALQNPDDKQKIAQNFMEISSLQLAHNMYETIYSQIMN
jgi:hypothetical protein